MNGRKPLDSKPGLRDPKRETGNSKPAVESWPPVPRVIEKACGEIALPVWDCFGGPVCEPPAKK